MMSKEILMDSNQQDSFNNTGSLKPIKRVKINTFVTPPKLIREVQSKGSKKLVKSGGNTKIKTRRSSRRITNLNRVNLDLDADTTIFKKSEPKSPIEKIQNDLEKSGPSNVLKSKVTHGKIERKTKKPNDLIEALKLSNMSQSIESEVASIETETGGHSLSFFLIQMLSGRNKMDWNLWEAEEVLYKLMKFAIDGEKIVKLKVGDIIIEKRITWDTLMEADSEDPRTSLHSYWRDVIFEDRGYFWKDMTINLDPISLWLYNCLTVSRRCGSFSKGNGANARKINFVIRGLIECLFLSMGKEYPLDKNDVLYNEWKGRYNWTEGPLKLPEKFASLVPGIRIDQNWDKTVSIFEKNPNAFFKLKFDFKNVNNKTERCQLKKFFDASGLEEKIYKD